MDNPHVTCTRAERTGHCFRDYGPGDHVQDLLPYALFLYQTERDLANTGSPWTTNTADQDDQLGKERGGGRGGWRRLFCCFVVGFLFWTAALAHTTSPLLLFTIYLLLLPSPPSSFRFLDLNLPH